MLLNLLAFVSADDCQSCFLCAGTGRGETNQAADSPCFSKGNDDLVHPIEPSVNNVVAAVDVERLAGDQLRRIHGKECHGDADVLDRHQATRRSFRLRLLQ